MNNTTSIWCEAVCRKCGRSAPSSGYYSPERITQLQVETKNWEMNDEEYEILCPVCREEVSKIRHPGISRVKSHHCIICGNYIEQDHLQVCDRCASEYKF